ncbi:hypothetical protein M3Y97_01170100 [Aphelenchoides bicaudatus]|nr:hypothetical protein M3Y97_01170100 [Aphelenchoides bicaudatus]
MTGHLSVIYTLAIATQSYRLRLTQHSSFSRSAFEWLERPGNTSSFLNCSAFLNFLFCLTIFTDFNFYTVDVHSIPAFTVLIEKHPDFVAISMNKNYYYFGAVMFCASCCLTEFAYCLKVNIETFKAVRATRLMVTDQTLRLQLAMYRMFSVQLLVLALFFFMPIVESSLRLSGMTTFDNCGTLFTCFMVLNSPIQFLINIIGYSSVHNVRNARHSNAGV